MIPGGGKQKGASFERQICVDLSLWVSCGERRDLFWRSAMSGGRATQARKTVKIALPNQVGDITAIDRAGLQLTRRYVIECKSVRSLDLPATCCHRGGALAKFWGQVSALAIPYQKLPMMLAKQNRYPPLLFLPQQFSAGLCRAGDRPQPLVVFPSLQVAGWDWGDFRLRIPFTEFIRGFTTAHQ